MYGLDWYNQNSVRRYPFKDTATLLDVSATLELPESFTVDALVAVNQNFQYEFYLSNILYTSKYITLTISLADGTEALKGTLENPVLDDYNTVNLSGMNDYTGSFGRMVIFPTSELLAGDYTFNFAATVLEPCKIIKANIGVSSINGIQEGNVILDSRSNTRITVDGKKIFIDSLDGLCACEDNPCIKTINGIEPVNNDFRVNEIGCVQITPIENGINVANRCEDACCGCDEVNDFVDQLRLLEARIQALEANS